MSTGDSAPNGFYCRIGDELSDDMKIEAPGGNTQDLHRRVWLGVGGTCDSAFLRTKISDFGLRGELELATPWNLACFKVKGGAKAYFHGGLSPQELIIPVMILSLKPSEVTTVRMPQVSWTLIPGSKKISTRFFSLQVRCEAAGLFDLTPPKVRVEIRIGNVCISTPVSASYGFEEATGNVQLRLAADNPRAVEPDTVTLMITEQPAQTGATAHLLDAVAGTELKRSEPIEMAIAI